MTAKNEKRIRDAFKQKSWNEIKTFDSWRIFKIMAEFVEGFEELAKMGPCVSVFGSARTKPGTKYYEIAFEIGLKLTELGYGVITGGGPGVMEAANKGAMEGEGTSVGLNIDLPFEQNPNIYIDRDKLINFDPFEPIKCKLHSAEFRKKQRAPFCSHTHFHPPLK